MNRSEGNRRHELGSNSSLLRWLFKVGKYVSYQKCNSESLFQVLSADVARAMEVLETFQRRSHCCFVIMLLKQSPPKNQSNYHGHKR